MQVFVCQAEQLCKGIVSTNIYYWGKLKKYILWISTDNLFQNFSIVIAIFTLNLTKYNFNRKISMISDDKIIKVYFLLQNFSCESHAKTSASKGFHWNPWNRRRSKCHNLDNHWFGCTLLYHRTDSDELLVQVAELFTTSMQGYNWRRGCQGK